MKGIKLRAWYLCETVFFLCAYERQVALRHRNCNRSGELLSIWYFIFIHTKDFAYWDSWETRFSPRLLPVNGKVEILLLFIAGFNIVICNFVTYI
jgi:hypothetical protein